MKLAFIVPPQVELLDLAGPVQVFREAKTHGLNAEIEFYSYQSDNKCTAGIAFGKMESYTNAKLKEGDFIFIPGTENDYLHSAAFKSEKAFFKWLRDCAAKKINICSVCTGAFALGEAGLLDERECTTHWRRVSELQTRFPKAKVLADVLYVNRDNIYTSAGISAGIDMALSIVEQLKNAHFAHKVARGLVVYHRRADYHTQQSVYLDFRNHINPKIHAIQDHLAENLSAENGIDELAEKVAMSPRNLSRVFKATTGLTIIEYLTRLRKENAVTLLSNPDYTVDFVASQCGYKSARQLQRILKQNL